MRLLKWGIALAGLAVGGVVVIGGLGLGWAQAQDGGEVRDLYQQELSERLGLTVEELTALREEAFNAALDEAVVLGIITAERAEAIRDREPGSLRHDMRPRAMAAFKSMFATGSEIIGIEPEALREALMSGQTPAEVAADNGISREELKAGIVASVETRLQEALDAGDITQELYDRMVGSLDEKVEAFLDAVKRLHRDGAPPAP